MGSLKRSTLLKKVNRDTTDPTIRDEFMKWNKAGGQVLEGLTRRRKAEADLFFTECTLQHEDGSPYTEEELATMDKPDPNIVEDKPQKPTTLTGHFQFEDPKPENKLS